MATTLAELLATPLADKSHTYTERDTILYALGIGLGADPMDEAQLHFVYEKELRALPTFPVVLGATRIRDIGLPLDYVKLVHGEQAVRMHKLPPVAGTVITRSSLAGVLDKGPDKGSVIVLRREVADAATGERYATIDMTIFARGDGGMGSSMAEPPPPRAMPDRPSDFVVDLPTLPQAALIYRLSGDLNPLHAEPSIARRVGFERPILHGLATFGVVGHAVLKTMCDYNPTRLRGLKGRFSAPVLPGDRIQVSLWREANDVCVRAAVPERNVVVFNNGVAEID
jgi:acyl dehydratase